MARTPILNANRIVIGYIEEQGGGKQKALDRNAMLLGYYDPSTNSTLNANRMKVGTGTDAKRSKFNNYFSTLRYLIPGWAIGEIPLSKRDDVLRGNASFLSVYAHQKKLEKEEATSFNDAVERLTASGPLHRMPRLRRLSVSNRN